jgi:hypothetical protein
MTGAAGPLVAGAAEQSKISHLKFPAFSNGKLRNLDRKIDCRQAPLRQQAGRSRPMGKTYGKKSPGNRYIRETSQVSDTTTECFLPPYVLKLLENQPINIDRRAGADLITKHLFPVSHRTLESWPLPTQLVNGKAIVSTRTLLEVAYAKLASAPVIMAQRRVFSPGVS